MSENVKHYILCRKQLGIDASTKILYSNAEKSVDLDDSLSDNLMQNPQSRLYEVCKQLISVTEDVCKLQNEYAEPIFEILIECWKPEALTSVDEKNAFFEGKMCSLRADIDHYMKRVKDQPDIAPNLFGYHVFGPPVA